MYTAASGAPSCYRKHTPLLTPLLSLYLLSIRRSNAQEERNADYVNDSARTLEAARSAADLRFATATSANEGIAILADECSRLECRRSDADARLVAAIAGELGALAVNKDSDRRESIRIFADARLAAANVAEASIAAIDAQTAVSHARRQAADDRLIMAKIEARPRPDVPRCPERSSSASCHSLSDLLIRSRVVAR